jgi:hypothetical protein
LKITILLKSVPFANIFENPNKIKINQKNKRQQITEAKSKEKQKHHIKQK